jgi:hypothetical protein
MTRGRTIAVLSILTLVVGIVLGALPDQTARADAGDKSVELATNTGINYPAFPNTNQSLTPPYSILTGGPYIVAATYRPAVVTPGGTSAEVLLVFNENILNTSPTDVINGSGGGALGTVNGHGNASFWPTGFGFTGVTVVNNTVSLTGATVPAAGARIRLAKIHAVQGFDDGSLSSDVSQITVGTGPVITSVAFVSGYGDSTADNDSIRVTFDANVAFGSGDGPGNTFWQTSEFGMTAANVPASMLLSLVATNTIPLGLNDLGGNPSHHHFRYIKAGVSKLVMEASKVAWTAATTPASIENSQALTFPIQAPAGKGPFVRAVYYNTAGGGDTDDDEIWVVMSAPVDPASFGLTINASFNTDADVGGWSIPNGVGSVTNPFGGDFSSVVKLSSLPPEDEKALPGAGDRLGAWTGAAVGHLKNYQGVYADDGSVPVLQGPGIIRASYDDKRTTDFSQHQLYIWLNERVVAPANIGMSDFSFSGFNATGLSLTTIVQSSTQRITISGFTAANYPRPGSRVQAVASSEIFGTVSTLEMAGGPTAPMVRIEDESRPWTLRMIEDTARTYDRWNSVLGIDSMFVAWSETGGDDSDQYFLFVTKENPDLVDATWMDAKLPRAIALGNLHPGVIDGLIRVGVLIDTLDTPGPGAHAPGTGPRLNTINKSMDDTNPDLEPGDQIYILVASADYQGNLSLRFDQNSTANHVFGAFLVGPLCQPRDFISNVSVPAKSDSVSWDDDVIHVVGDTTALGIQYYVYGDPGAIPCSADDVVVYRASGSIAAGDVLGSGPIGADGSFTYIALNKTIVDANPTDRYIFLRTRTGVDASADLSDATPIIFDRQYPYVRANQATPFADFIFDPWNPYRIYNQGDYVNLRLLATDAMMDTVPVPPPTGPTAPDLTNPNARNALLHVWADFSRLDNTGGDAYTAITGFGTPRDSIELVSLGADQVDNDGDWRGYTESNGTAGYQVGEALNNDVGLDGIPGTRDRGEGDGLPTFGDPYVDENGDGSFTPGETFLDRVNKPTGGAFAIRDPGEPNLDSQDSDEFGWYELRNTTANTIGTVKQGYVLANPNIDGRLWPYCPVKIWLEDNGIQRTGSGLASMPNYVNRSLPFMDGVGANTEPQGYCRNLSHVTTHLGDDAAPWDPERTFRAQIDLKAPTVAEIDSLWRETTPTSTSLVVNEILPGNPVYNLGRYVDFTVSTLSDWDVLYNRAQIKVGGIWRDLNLDPSVASGAANDGNGDLYPGTQGYDEDNDGGVDFADVQVRAASIDSTQDANSSAPTGLHCMNDRRDNDNDAFFVYDSYANGGLAGVGNIGRITWYNIDESTTNNFDDDNDGLGGIINGIKTADPDEVPENVGYGTGVNDDNEDGIVNGEAVAVFVRTPPDKAISDFSRLAGLEARAHLNGNFLAAAASVPANTIYVDAAHIFGTRPLAGNDAKNLPFYFNNVAYPEPVPEAYEILTNSDRLFTPDGYDLDGGTDSTATQQFNWARMHATNLDMQLIQKIHGLSADGVTPYQLRTLAYDKAGNMATAWTEPITFTIDLAGPAAQIPGCNATGTPPPEFADVSATLPGVQIWDSGKHPGKYTLTATAGGDAVKVSFFAWTSPDIATILAHSVSVDNTAPFTAQWPALPATGMFAMDNYPYNHQQTWYYLAVAEDAFGNVTPTSGLCVFQATVLDGTQPTICLSQVGDDADLRDGAVVPPDSSINVFVYTQDPPLPGRFEDNDLRMWSMGADDKPGVAGVDDDGDGSIDETDWGPDLTYGTNDDEWNGSNLTGLTPPAHSEMNFGQTDDYMTRGWVGGLDRAPGVRGLDDDGDGHVDNVGMTALEGDYGIDGLPGTDDDEWNGSGSNLGETDDYRTNDIVKVVFQMNPIADVPDRGWITFATVHGDTNSVAGQVIDWTEPVKATWNTWGLATGDYNLRAWGVDWEGNSNELTACITTVGIRSNPLRAYIQPEVCTGGLAYDLYAVHYIHDYEIDRVRFEYYFDANGDRCANDAGSAWTTIGTDDGSNPNLADPRGDATLYPPANQIENNDPIQDLVYRSFAVDVGPRYMFFDPDLDGYSPRDPVVYDNGVMVDGFYHFNEPADVIVIGSNAVIPANAKLTAFRDDEFWAESGLPGEITGLDPTDWIFRQNEMNVDEEIGSGLNRWRYPWDATGLPEGNYLVRSIAIDENNITDVISYTCYAPNMQNPEEIELVRVDTQLPNTNITTLTLPDASAIDVSAMAVPPYISGNTKWIKVAATGDADTGKMLFEYSLNGGVTWVTLDVNNDDDFYADINGTAGWQAAAPGAQFNDEIFNDLNGNFVYDPGVDFVRYDGGDGVVDTPRGWPLRPLIGEDDATPVTIPPTTAVDADGDDQFDEDPPVGTVQTPTELLPGNPEDYNSPFYVYLDISKLTLLSDVNVLLRATAYDVVCNNIYRPDPTPDVLAVIIGENQQPEADVIRVEDLNGDELDTRPAIMDGDGVDTFGADLDSARVYVTAEDLSSLVAVDLFYRLDPACYTSVPADQQQRPTDLALVLDGSASIDAASFTLQKEGIAAALTDAGIIPANGTVSLAVVQFANGVGVTEIPRTVITSPTVAASLAAQARAMVQRGDGTPTAAGIDMAVAAIGAGTSGARQVIIIATDGVPTDPEPASLALSSALAAADNAMAHGVDELHALGIGSGVDMAFLAQLVRHGSVEQISSYTGFAAAIGSKIQSIIFNTLLDARQWKSMSADGLLGPPGVDTTYPYDFNIATDRILDGVYQFYPRAYDANGTYNAAPVNPWGFKKFALADVNFAYVSTPAGPPAVPDEATAASEGEAGDEYVIHASLQDPLMAPTVKVEFYYAQRILGEVVDPALVQPLAPFTAPALTKTILGAATGDGMVVKINGTLGTYHSDLADVAAPTKLDFTVNAVNQVVFGARPGGGDEILVSYNFTSAGFLDWKQVTLGDTWSPYTVAWSQADGGVPEPDDADTDAYDLIAIAKFDLNGDGTYSDDPTACDYNEPKASEGNYLYLRDEARPQVILYGLAYEKFVPPFPYLDWNWPGNPLFRSGDELTGPNYENKLSGIETDVFVEATDTGGGEVASVKLDITASEIAGGQTEKTSIDMTKISKDTEFIDIPITFYEDDYYSFFVTGFGPFDLHPAVPIARAWESAPIENVVLQVSVDHGSTWTRQYQMVRDVANRSWSAVGRFDTGIVDEGQWYQFIVDLVGDQQTVMPDARNLGQTVTPPKSGALTPPAPSAPYAPYFSALNVPSTADHAFWYTHLDNATQLQNNAFHRVLVTATDTFGNTGTNLTSTMPIGKAAMAQGPIVFVLDQTPPMVNSIMALNADNQPLPVARVSPSMTYRLMANVSDYPFGDINVMSTLGVIYQYSPNNWVGNPSPTWISIEDLGWALNGMWVTDWTPVSPLTDGYDNDGDGVWDEPGEAIAQVTIRAIAFDDGFNSGYSDRQATPVTLTLTVDAAEPSAALTQPVDGEVFGYSEPILLSGTAIGDYLPPKATSDVDIVRFQAKINRFFYVDETEVQAPGKVKSEPLPDPEPELVVVGKDGVYENGLDEVWWDSDGDGEFSAADSCLYGGGNQDCFAQRVSNKDFPTAHFWFDLDPTPQDNSDDPWLTSANNGNLWEMTWVPSGYSFINADLLGGDEYVRLRMLSRDTAGNWDTPADLLGPKETVIILNDDSVTRAYITHVGTNDQDGTVDPAETKPVQGLNGINVYGQMFAAGLQEVVQVNVYMVTNPDGASPDTSLVFIDNSIGGDGLFTGIWDASVLPEAEYVLFATAVDIDQNETSKHDATKVRVRIDRTPPVVNYSPLGTYAGFTTAASYTDDSIVNHSSMVIVPDVFTEDVDLRVTTTASDVRTMELQWRFAGDPVGFWRPVSEFFVPTMQPDGVFDYEPNQNFVVSGVVHHVWWLHLENFADKLKESGRMEFRALATDEAGNTNALQTEFAAYTADNTDPTGFDWNDDSPTNQIEVGTVINFEVSVQDAPLNDDTRTDIVGVALEVRTDTQFSSKPLPGPAFTEWQTPVGEQIDSGNAMWIARFAWTAPEFVVHDTKYYFDVLLKDSAGNVSRWHRTDYAETTVEDNVAPDRTKLVDIVAVAYTNTSTTSLGSCWLADNTCSVTHAIECSNGVWRSGGTCSPSETGSCCIGAGVCQVKTLAECLGVGTWTGGRNCSPNPCSQPMGSCCASGGSCSVTTPSGCNGAWTLNGVCSPDPCPHPDGTCCTGVGTCTIKKQAACSGTWAMGGSCSPNPCGQPTGACCPPEGGCVITYANTCTGWFTPGGNCSPGPCSPPYGACCSNQGVCNVKTEDQCHSGNWTQGVDCEPTTCTGPSGACCNPADGHCLLTTEVACVEAGGIFNVGYVCSPNPCSAGPGGKRLKSADDPWLWKDLDGNGSYTAGVDWLISEGSELSPPANGTGGVPTGDECATFPRNVGESYLNDARVRNAVKVARTITLVGRTQSDDDGIGQLDTGIQWVTFLLAPCDANGVLSAQSEWITLGRDEYRPNFPLFYWHLTFDTTPYADGTYKVGVYAMDEEGNVEDQTSLDWTKAIIVIDNEEPSAQMDADARTDVVEKTLTVERNRSFTLFARTLIPGTATLQDYEDDTVEFFFKRARDLNMEDSWASVDPYSGADEPEESEDGNPDLTRPYSFDVNMGLLAEPTDNHTAVPLSVGETYDFAAAASDEVCNETTHIESYADSAVAGILTRYIRVLIQDTIAPHLEFTAAMRKAPFGDENYIENPTKLHAQGFHFIEAELLAGDLDMDHAEFVYRVKGTTTWSLIDAALTSSEDGREWTLGEWDLQTLQHNTWYEVACIGVDDVGNVDQSPDIIEVYVDYSAPPFVLVSPDSTTSKWCNGVMDLVVEVTRGIPQADPEPNDDVYDVAWLWKDSTHPDVMAPNDADPSSEGWHTLGVATSEELYDDATNRYSNTLNLDGTVAIQGKAPTQTVPIFETDLYDFRVKVTDVAGNVGVYDVYKNTVDRTPPNYAQISNIKLNGDDTTQDPSDQGQSTDVTIIKAGDLVEIFGTASDDEPALPNYADPGTGVFYETMISTLQFQVAYDLNKDGRSDQPLSALTIDGAWHDIGVVHLDPPTLGDMSAQTSSILWNTSGLPEGDYLLQVIATDECGNERTSPPVNVRVEDWTPPIARIVAWDADQQPHGTPAPSFLTIYALAECDTSDADHNPSNGWQPTYDVQLQYNVKNADEVVPIGDWVNIGIATPQDAGNRFTTEHIWAATIDPMLFGDDVTSVWLRALVKDDAGLRYGDDPADIVPTILANVVRQVDDLGVSDGTITLQQEPSADLQGGAEMVEKVSIMVESPTHVIITAKMAVQDQMPRVILLWEPAEPDANEYPSGDNPENLSPGTDGGLVRSLDDPTVWRGEFYTQGAECNLYGVWVTGLDGTAATAMWIDLKEAYFREFPVTEALGTNGTVVTPAYVNLGSKVMVPSGSWPAAPACLIVSPTEPPITSRDQERYLQPVDKTAYHLELQADPLPFTHGYEPLVTFEYSGELALAALAETEGAAESDLTVRRWNPKAVNRDGTNGAWVGTGLTHIKAYPDNNEVVFRVDNLTNPFGLDKDVFARSDSSAGNVFQIFAPKRTAPVLVSNIWPNSPYVTDWWTDADPVIVVYLRDPGGQVINPNEVELLIDGEYWATWLDGEGSAEFVRGNGGAQLDYSNQDQTVMELVYHHSTYPRDWLANGAHRLTVRYRALDGTDDWMEMKDYPFSVDRKSPYIEFDGGFVTNPNLSNVVGYMNPQRGKLVVKLYDEGMGILFKHDRPWYYADLDCDGILNPDERQFDPVPYPDSTWLDPLMRNVNCWLRADWGMKYDVWRIHTPDQQPPHDHQNDIDNIEVRTLLHQGTANDLEPWIMQNGARITLDEYDPTDTLVVPMPVLGGGVIKDNDIVEITWYSDKSIEQNSDGPGWGCIVDTVLVNGLTRLFWDPSCAYDSESQEMHIYNEGIQDWASNSGSKYVEQRFIVDMSCPVITFVEPATSIVDPNGDLHVVVTALDSGVGVGSFDVTIMDPSGNLVTPSEVELAGGRYHATVRGPLVRGEYTVKAVATDRLGTGCEKAMAVKVEALVLAMTEAVAAPNPFNPQGADKALGGLLNIGFNLEKKADVTIKVYDFAGLEVATVANQKTLEAGYRTEPWAGEASDHTALANGAYILRITATDGVKTVEQNLKLVIWRE